MSSINWSAGKDYQFAWGLYIAATVIAMLLNGISLYIVGFNKNVWSKINLVAAIWILTIVDFVGSLCCFARWSMNNFHEEIYGHEMGCAAEGYIFTFFTLCQAGILALIAFITERTVCAGMKFRDVEVFRMAAMTVLISGSFTAIGVFAPYGGYRLMPSGTFCFIDLTTTIGGALFAFSVLASTGIMLHRYVRIWRYLRAARQLLRRRGFRHVRAKTQNFLVSMKMFFFTVTFFICAIPFLLSEIYEIITFEYVSPAVSILGALLLLIAAVVDPILFLFLNAEMEDAIKSEFGHIIAPLFGIKNYKFVPQVTQRVPGVLAGLDPRGTSFRIVPVKLLADHDDTCKPLAIVPAASSHMMDNIRSPASFRRSSTSWRPKKSLSKARLPAAEWEGWLGKREYWKLFETWCESVYVIESVLFYRDVQSFQRKAADMAGKIEWMLKQNGYRGEEEELRRCNSTNQQETKREEDETLPPAITTEDVPQHILAEWKSLQDVSARVYEIYILAPTAPLEINIPATARLAIQKNLGINGPSTTAAATKALVVPFAATTGSTPVAPLAVSAVTTNTVVSVPAAVAAAAAAAAAARNELVTPKFPEVWLLPPSEAMRKMHEVENIFTEALDIITALITMDVFPRFKKTDAYKTIKTTSVQSLRRRAAVTSIPEDA